MGRLKAPESGVNVRMYRQGLGDCFLLTFPTDQADKPYHMLIDCGVIVGTPEPVGIMNEVAKNIFEETGGEIHLMVITHEHWDHLSGFIQADKVFGKFKVHKLWFAWTEDPLDPKAKKVKTELQKQREALTLVLQKAVNSDSVAPINALLEFFGDTSPLDAAGRKGTGDALEFVRKIAAKTSAEPEYRKPGEGPLPLPTASGLSVPGAEIYVLGPPFNTNLLKRTDPRKAEGYHEEHSHAATAVLNGGLKPSQEAAEKVAPAAGLNAGKAFLMGALPTGPEEVSPVLRDLIDPELRELSFPFEERLRLPKDKAAKFAVKKSDGTQQLFFDEYYGFEHYSKSPQSTSNGAKKLVHESAWRRIDDDWLGSAGEFALQLDSYTNNTSLAMAIELKGTGKVLMFVADAQAGNWISWAGLSREVQKGDETRTITIADLFANTVLYKVGHHGSHNATMSTQGLELMTNEDLVAMIPVDEYVAHEIKNWKRMPFEPITMRLDELTRGRVMRVDKGVPDKKHEGLSKAEWAAFQKQARAEKLFVEYTVLD